MKKFGLAGMIAGALVLSLELMALKFIQVGEKGAFGK